MSDPTHRRIALEHAARFTHLPPEQVLKAAHSFLSFLENWPTAGSAAGASGQPQRLIQPPADLPAGFACYCSHKTVWADKIEKLHEMRDGTGTQIGCASGAVVLAEPGMFERYTPVPGDYLVIYEDGYRSISPKAAFEGGYTKG